MTLHRHRVLATKVAVGDNVVIRITVPGGLSRSGLKVRKAPQTVASIEGGDNGEVRFHYGDGTRSKWYGPQTQVQRYHRLPRAYRKGIYLRDIYPDLYS